MFQLNVVCKLYPRQFAGMISVLQRASLARPQPEMYADQLGYLAELTVYTVIVEYKHRLGRSTTVDKWRTKKAGKQHRYNMPTAVVLALWQHLKAEGAFNEPELSYFDLITKLLVDGNLVELAPKSTSYLTDYQHYERHE